MKDKTTAKAVMKTFSMEFLHVANNKIDYFDSLMSNLLACAGKRAIQA